MPWSIQEVARRAGTTSRTLRHYDAIGLLAPTGVAANGYRQYDDAALVRLQRILLLRELGVGLPQIAEILARPVSEEQALQGHLAWLREEQQRLARQIASVQTTIETLREEGDLMPETMFDGFDPTRYSDEVAERWGADTAAASDAWWRRMDAGDRRDWQALTAELNADWRAVAEGGSDPAAPEAQALAVRHVAWLAAVPGTPRGADLAGYLTGLADLYVADERFASNYGGEAGAAFVRDALRAYVAEL